MKLTSKTSAKKLKLPSLVDISCCLKYRTGYFFFQSSIMRKFCCLKVLGACAIRVRSNRVLEHDNHKSDINTLKPKSDS